MINWLKSIFKSQEIEEEILTMNKFLIVGLGNIGTEYVNTRHNIGFKILDFFARKEQLQFQDLKLGAVANFSLKGKVLLY